MIRFSEIITTFAFELERHEGLKCGSFNTCLDNGNSAHA